MSKKDLVMFACPPYLEFKEAPEDQPGSALFDCPHCDGKMWLSEKKKGYLMLSTCLGKNIFFACYHCILKIAQKNKKDFLESKIIRI